MEIFYKKLFKPLIFLKIVFFKNNSKKALKPF